MSGWQISSPSKFEAFSEQPQLLGHNHVPISLWLIMRAISTDSVQFAASQQVYENRTVIRINGFMGGSFGMHAVTSSLLSPYTHNGVRFIVCRWVQWKTSRDRYLPCLLELHVTAADVRLRLCMAAHSRVNDLGMHACDNLRAEWPEVTWLWLT